MQTLANNEKIISFITFLVLMGGAIIFMIKQYLNNVLSFHDEIRKYFKDNDKELTTIKLCMKDIENSVDNCKKEISTIKGVFNEG